jgi:hypothetical protein
VASGQDFTDIMPAAGLEGWTELPYGFTYPPEWYEDLAQRGVDVTKLRVTPVPPGQWHVDQASGHIVCKGDSWHSWLRFDRRLRDFEVHVEWCFKKLERPALYNSGVFVRNDPEKNIFTQVETGYDRTTAGFFFTKKFAFGQKRAIYGSYPDANGVLRVFDPWQPRNATVINPPGEWNSYDIKVVGRRAELTTNGLFNNVFETELEDGYFGLEAERYWIEFRNIRLREL